MSLFVLFWATELFTIKGKINKDGEMRRYFNCTGKSHKKSCTGPKGSIYAEDLENMVYDCISEKLLELKATKRGTASNSTAEVNDLKLKIKAIEISEKQLMDTMLSGGFNEDLLTLANQKATQLKRDRLALYDRKKEVAMIMIHKIIISADGGTKIIWNI